MHEYYQKKEKKLKKEMDSYLKLISKELEEDCKIPYSNLKEEIWLVYKKDFVERFPFIGGDKSSGTKNLTGGFVYVAMGEVCTKNYGMTLERWGYLSTLAYQRFFARIPSFVAKIMGWALRKEKLAIKMLHKKDEKNAANAKLYPGSFETKTQEPSKEYPLNFHMLVCPLANFAKEYGYMKYMPYICNLDYVMFERLQIPFYREFTCASGDGFCDFKLKAGAAVNTAWPCHAVTEGDPLK